jgi:hypothetical protein
MATGRQRTDHNIGSHFGIQSTSFQRLGLSASSIQTGAWSLVFFQPRTWASTCASVSRAASGALRSR